MNEVGLFVSGLCAGAIAVVAVILFPPLWWKFLFRLLLALTLPLWGLPYVCWMLVGDIGDSEEKEGKPWA
ncbi:MAG TPA: hypothetical protein VK327_02245 [Candidatus Paceibacterota bacterium]|nr:hypothetical protein [Candidatus Paceibacterota bacterium]